MAYTARHEWCLSSIPAIFCPSNVDKSTQPCPLLSSSLASTSLISTTNSHCITISTDTISLPLYSNPQEKAAHVLSSSLDYYTRKRIEQLHERMDDIQIGSFLKFINYHLSSKTTEQNHIKDLSKDLSNGHVLIDLIEIFSSTKLKREHGRTRFHSLTNVQYVLDYLKSHMQHINISPHDIVSGNRKQILALLWIIMKIFDFPSFRITTNKHLFNENTLFAFGQDRSVLLKWINNLLNKILTTKIIYIKDFYIQTWLDTSYLSLIMKYLSPLSMKYETLQCLEYLKQLEEFNFIDQQQRLELCVDLSNYIFNTMGISDYKDPTEKSLFRFFSELQQNILFILKTNHIGKLTKNNPYIKQILDTVLETTIIDHSEIINDEEDYLICTDDEHLSSFMGKEGLDYDEQQQQSMIGRKNRWNEKEDLQSDLHNIESLKQEQSAASTYESTQITVEGKELEQSMEALQESTVDTELSSLNTTIIESFNEELLINNDSIQNQSILRFRKAKKQKRTISNEKLASLVVPPPPTPSGDLFLKIIECLRDRKLIAFKYIFILVCLCFSLLIIFIHTVY